MRNGVEGREKKLRKRAGFLLKVEGVEAKMREEGWKPERLGGHSKRYLVTIPGMGQCTVALKVMGESYRGWIGFRQKIDGNWASPLTDSDFLLYATPHKGRLGVWRFPIARVIERLVPVQTVFDDRGWAVKELWINIFKEGVRGALDPCQLNLAEGKPPMWLLPLEANGEAEDGDEPAALPSLAAYSVGQLIDELQRRGLKSFSF